MTIENEKGGNNIYEPIQPDPPEKKSYIVRLEEEFLDIPTKIEAELNTSTKNNNNWLNCFCTRITIINGLLSQAHKHNELDSEKYIPANIKMLQLIEKVQKLMFNTEYQGKDAIIPEEIKQELLDFLTWSNILGE